jgi:hypothetical protein
VKSSPPKRARVAVLFVGAGLLSAFATGFSLGRLSGDRDRLRGGLDPGAGPDAVGTLVTDPGSDCDEPASARVEIVQDRADGPVGVAAAWFGEQEQAIAQTFTSPGAGLRLNELSPTFDYALGKGATLSVYAISDARDPMSGTELMRARLDSGALLSGEPARIRLDPTVAVECGGVYSIVIRPGPGSELSIQATASPRSGNVYSHGAMFMGRPGRWEATGGDMRFRVVLAPASAN